MKVIVDNVSTGESTTSTGPGGMRSYLAALIETMARQSPDTSFLIMQPDWSDFRIDGLLSNIQTLPLPNVPRGRSARIVYQQTWLASAINRIYADVLWSPATIAPLAVQLPTLLVAQFLQFFEAPSAGNPVRNFYLRQLFPASVKKATRVVSSTEHAKNSIVHFAKTEPSKVLVIPHGLSGELWESAALPDGHPALWRGFELTDGRPYAVYVSATYEYKNHLRLIRAFGRFVREYRSEMALLLVGTEAGVPANDLRKQAEASGIGGGVVIAGRIARASEVYRKSVFSIMPSLAETFGFPILEAMACGAPVLTANYGSMAELADDAALLINPLSEKSMSAGMGLLNTSPALRDELVARGRQQAVRFTWPAAAATYLRVLRECAQR